MGIEPMRLAPRELESRSLTTRTSSQKETGFRIKCNKVLLYESFEICKMWDSNPRAFQHYDLAQELVLVRSLAAPNLNVAP
jgi:hypothetical protein